LLETIRKKTGLKFDPEAFRFGFARRETGYSALDLILAISIVSVRLPRTRPLPNRLCRQAHPNDGGGRTSFAGFSRRKKRCGKQCQWFSSTYYIWNSAGR